VRELRTLLRDCCCPRTRTRKVCKYCIAYGKLKMKRSFKLRISGNKGIFTCNEDHPSIYINGGSSEDKLELGKEFLINVGTIIYMREPGGNRDDVKMEFHVVAIDDNEKEIVVETDTTTIETAEKSHDDDDTIDVVAGKSIGLDATEATTAVTTTAVVLDVDVNVDAKVFDKTIIATPINSKPILIGSVSFALPVDLLSSNEATPSFRSAPDPPESSKKLTIRNDPTGASPQFRMQSPPPIRSPLPVKVNKDEESWLQEARMNPRAKRMDYSTTKKCKKE
jgi:hypothetical protein